MAIRDLLKVSRKTFFDPAAWLGYNSVKSNTVYIWNNLKNTLFPTASGRTETFEEALDRLQLTEADLQNTTNYFRGYVMLFLVLGICSLASGFFLLFHYKTISGWILACCVALLFFSQAFRFHFWLFQIKHRKLGCTFQEWWQGKIATTSERR